MPTRPSKVGAVFYALWGVIHIIGGAVLLQAALTGTDAIVRAQVGSSPVELLPMGAPGPALPWADAWIGPALFVPAWLFSTQAMRSRPTRGVSAEDLRPVGA